MRVAICVDCEEEQSLLKVFLMRFFRESSVCRDCTLCDNTVHLQQEHKQTRYMICRRFTQTYIPVNEIMYFESANTRCHIHCVNGQSYTIYKQLREVEQELCDERFLRCHQSFLVNMNYIREAKDVFVLLDGTEILIRQKSKTQMHRRVYEYLKCTAELLGAGEL